MGTVGENCWLGSLTKRTYRMGSTVAQVHCSVFLVRWHTQQLGGPINLLPCLGRAIEQALQPVWLIVWGLDLGRTVH